MRIVHVLKVHPQFWDALKSGSKPFEVRRNDRKFVVGDGLRLVRYDPEFGIDRAAGFIELPITYILAHEDFPQGVPVGYVVLGLGNHPQFDDKR